MSEDGVVDERCGLVAGAMDVPAVSVTDASSAETVAAWDSAAGMSLMVLLEETNGLLFEADEMARLTPVGATREALRHTRIAA
jgi:hypothetical protein